MKRWWILGWLMVPALTQAESCGMVSTAMAGPQTQNIYAARIGAVDEQNTLMQDQEHKLTPGKHQLRIYEFIDAPELKVKPRQRGFPKLLTVEIVANKRYHIGARFNTRQAYDRNEFWEPVVWDVTDVECKP